MTRSAADVVGTNLPTLLKLLAVAKDLHEKTGAVIAEMDAILGGKVGIGVQMRELMADFDALWCTRYAPGKTKGYVWNGTKDGPAAKRLLTTIGLTEAKARAFRYIKSDDPFYLRCRHTFSVFASSAVINRLVNEAEEFELDAPTVSDCKHIPPCASDQIHTRKKMADMRRFPPAASV